MSEWIKKLTERFQEVSEKKQMDKVNPDELKGTHAQRKDKDIDNDGDVDKSDEYLHNRRKAVKQAMKKEEVEIDEATYSIKNTKTGQVYHSSKYPISKGNEKLKKIRAAGGDHVHAAPHKDGKPVSEAKDYGPGHIGAVQKMLDKEREAKKAKDAMKKEEVEELDEISRDTARSYIRKASAHKTTGETPKKDRSSGVELAGKKAYGIGGKAKVMAKEEVELDEAQGTAAKYAGKSGMLGGKYTSHDRMIDMKNFNAVRDKRAKQKHDAHMKQDPKHAKAGYAQHMVDTDKAKKKAAKRGVDASHLNWRHASGLKQESTQIDEDLNAIAKDHDIAAKKHRAAFSQATSTAAARNHEVAYNRHVDAAKAHREAANDKSKHSAEKLKKMSDHAYDATDNVRKHFDESVELDEMTKKLTGGQRSAKMGASMASSERRIPKRGTKAYAAWMAKNDERRKAELERWKNQRNEEVELGEAAPKIKPDFIKTQREKDRAHDAAMGRTPTGRKKPMTSTQRSMASMRKESADVSEQAKIQPATHKGYQDPMGVGLSPSAKAEVARRTEAPSDAFDSEKVNAKNFQSFRASLKNKKMRKGDQDIGDRAPVKNDGK